MITNNMNLDRRVRVVERPEYAGCSTQEHVGILGTVVDTHTFMPQVRLDNGVNLYFERRELEYADEELDAEADALCVGAAKLCELQERVESATAALTALQDALAQQRDVVTEMRSRFLRLVEKP